MTGTLDKNRTTPRERQRAHYRKRKRRNRRLRQNVILTVALVISLSGYLIDLFVHPSVWNNGIVITAAIVGAVMVYMDWIRRRT